MLINGYAKSCSKKLAPVYEEVATKLLGEIVLVKVDATEEEGLAMKYSIGAFPTLKFFKHGKAYEYTGPRDESGMIAWLRDNAKPAATTITGDVLAFVDDSLYASVVAVLTGDDEDTRMAVDTVNEFAEKNRDKVIVGIVVDEAVLSRSANKGLTTGTLVVIQPPHLVDSFDGFNSLETLKLTETTTISDIKSFVNARAYAPVPFVRPSDAQILTTEKSPLVRCHEPSVGSRVRRRAHGSCMPMTINVLPHGITLFNEGSRGYVPRATQ